VLDESPEKAVLIDRLSRREGLTPFRANSRMEEKDAPLEERVQPPVEQWLRGFRDARMVVTDSFHACVFSILFHKPFVVVGNRRRGLARMESLLVMFGLEDRLCFEDSLCSDLKGIDWDRVDEKLEVWRGKSWRVLDVLNIG